MSIESVSHLIEDIPFSLITEERAHLAQGTVTGLALDLRFALLFDGGTGKRIARSIETVQSVPAH